MNSLKFIVVTVFVVVVSPLLLWIKDHPVLNIQLFSNAQYNAILNYQLTTLILAGLMIGLVAVLTGGEGMKLLNLKNIDGEITPEPWIGINPKGKESWKSLGVTFSIIITLVTAVVIFFQVFRKGEFSIEIFPGLVLVALFALSNSFVEEILYRFSFVGVGMDAKIPVLVIQGLSALTFGLIHYFGVPSGIPGVLMAGFIGWFLSKSMIETQGFFWAWLIHFLQDVVIFFALFMT
jgi:uncharacterized protein